jgi:hypothetical protein
LAIKVERCSIETAPPEVSAKLFKNLQLVAVKCD